MLALNTSKPLTFGKFTVYSAKNTAIESTPTSQILLQVSGNDLKYVEPKPADSYEAGDFKYISIDLIEPLKLKDIDTKPNKPRLVIKSITPGIVTNSITAEKKEYGPATYKSINLSDPQKKSLIEKLTEHNLEQKVGTYKPEEANTTTFNEVDQKWPFRFFIFDEKSNIFQDLLNALASFTNLQFQKKASTLNLSREKFIWNKPQQALKQTKDSVREYIENCLNELPTIINQLRSLVGLNEIPFPEPELAAETTAVE